MGVTLMPMLAKYFEEVRDKLLTEFWAKTKSPFYLAMPADNPTQGVPIFVDLYIFILECYDVVLQHNAYERHPPLIFITG